MATLVIEPFVIPHTMPEIVLLTTEDLVVENNNHAHTMPVIVLNTSLVIASNNHAVVFRNIVLEPVIITGQCSMVVGFTKPKFEVGTVGSSAVSQAIPVEVAEEAEAVSQSKTRYIEFQEEVTNFVITPYVYQSETISTGDTGLFFGASAGEFSANDDLHIYLNGVLLKKGDEVTWQSNTSILIPKAYDEDEITIILND